MEPSSNYWVYKSQPLVPTLSQVNPFYALPPYFIRVQFPPTETCGHFSLHFLNKTFMYLSSSSYMLHFLPVSLFLARSPG
jgi:hypothetical protein